MLRSLLSYLADNPNLVIAALNNLGLVIWLAVTTTISIVATVVTAIYICF